MTSGEFEERFGACHRSVYNICYQVFRDREAASDMAQETAIRAWQFRERYRPEQGDFSAWVARIAYRVCLSELRRRRRRPQEEHGVEPERLEAKGASEAGFEAELLDLLVESDMRERLLTCVEKLTPEERMMILLRASDNSWSQVAGAVGLAVRTCRDRYDRAVQRLRRCAGLPE